MAVTVCRFTLNCLPVKNFGLFYRCTWKMNASLRSFPVFVLTAKKKYWEKTCGIMWKRPVNTERPHAVTARVKSPWSHCRCDVACSCPFCSAQVHFLCRDDDSNKDKKKGLNSNFHLTLFQSKAVFVLPILIYIINTFHCLDWLTWDVKKMKNDDSKKVEFVTCPKE